MLKKYQPVILNVTNKISPALYLGRSRNQKKMSKIYSFREKVIRDAQSSNLIWEKNALTLMKDYVGSDVTIAGFSQFWKYVDEFSKGARKTVAEILEINC